MLLRSLLIASVLLSLPGSALAKDVETIQGTVEVVDGDSLRLGDRSLRLFGIDAPEGGQRCLDASGSSWDCGAAATARMRERVDGGVICTLRGKDVYDRDLVVCASLRTRIEVNASLVEDGFALAYRRYSEEYVAQEEAARKAGAGMWVGTFVAPWDHRAAKRSARTSKPSSSRRAICLTWKPPMFVAVFLEKKAIAARSWATDSRSSIAAFFRCLSRTALAALTSVATPGPPPSPVTLGGSAHSSAHLPTSHFRIATGRAVRAPASNSTTVGVHSTCILVNACAFWAPASLASVAHFRQSAQAALAAAIFKALAFPRASAASALNSSNSSGAWSSGSSFRPPLSPPGCPR